MEILVLVVHVIAALTIIGLVLLQHGKGADVGAAYLFGLGSVPFFAINNLVLIAVVGGVANIWAQTGLKARDVAILAAALALYDVLAVRQVAPGRISAGFAFLSGFIAFAITNAVGFHVFVGGPVRYRIYTQAGLDAADVGRIVGLSVMTFGLGLAVLTGLLFGAAPALHSSELNPSEALRGARSAIASATLPP